uniref:Protein FAM161A n=2 Tax=Callorhinchus milii TaxID=7868 RepID=A0A4W3GKG0_CALMI
MARVAARGSTVAMQPPHRESVLVTSCVRTPVNPHTEAPRTLSERQEALRTNLRQQRSRSSGASTGDDEKGNENDSGSAIDEKEESRQANDGQDSDRLSTSQLRGLSDEEYYKKLEELKNAHIHAMTQLEKLYQSKLCIRDLVSEDLSKTSGVYYSTTSERSPNEKTYEHYSTTELDSSVYSSLSGMSSGGGGDDDEEISRQTLLSSGRDRIQGMWDGFSVEDYAPHETPPESGSICVIKIKKVKTPKHWSPKITVPNPFQMTIREAEKKKNKIKSRSEIEMENFKLQKELEEAAECQKKFRANPVPAHTYIPFYEEIMQRNEERRMFAKMKNNEIVMAMQKPFKFIEREERKKQLRNIQMPDFGIPIKKNTTFKAKPVPKYIFDSKFKDRIQEEELYRAIKIQMRAQELLKSASLPKNMLIHNAWSEKRKAKCYGANKKPKFRPRINTEVPDFEMLHRKSQSCLMRKKSIKQTTVCEPFRLHTSLIASKKDKILQDIQADEYRLKETRWPYKSSRNLSKPCYDSNSPQTESSESETIKITDAAKKRKDAIRKALEEKRKKEEVEENHKYEKKLREQKFKKFISTRAQANDPHQSLAEVSESKLKQYRNDQRQRTQEYYQELEQIRERVSKRPLLLEELTQRNARRAAERHYAAALKDRGLSEDFVTRKGRTVDFTIHSSAETSEKIDEDNNIKEESSEDKSDGDGCESYEYQDDYEETEDELQDAQEEEDFEN